jgi:Flp pilus assembly protein TadG
MISLFQDHRTLPSQHAARRGVMLVVVAVCLIAVMAFVASSVDVGYMVVTESELQNAADAGALSGAKEIPNGRNAAIAAAQLWASKNVAAGISVEVTTEDVELGVWDPDTAAFTTLSSTSSESPTAIRVTCRRSQARGNALPLFIAPILGKSSADLKRSAVATLEDDKCGLIVGIDSVVVDNGDIDSYDSAIGSYASQPQRRNGNVCSDGPINIRNNGHVLGDALPGRGYTVNLPANVTGSTRPRLGPIRWSPIDVGDSATVNDNAAIPTSYWVGSRLAVTNTEELILPPGTYYFPDGFEVTGSAAMFITGPTRFVVGGTSHVTGTGIVNATCVPGNLRIDVIGSSVAFGGNSEFHADIYAPEADVMLNGSADFYGAVFAKSIAFNGNLTAIHADEALERDYASNRTRSVLKD